MQIVANLLYSTVMGALPGYLMGNKAMEELEKFPRFKNMPPEKVYIYKVWAIALSVFGFFIGGIAARMVLPAKADDAFLKLAARGIVQVGVGFGCLALQALGWLQVGIGEYMRQARNGEI
jgi:hypothetical protein